ncbi:MAG: GNAT family N-acetyltransferase [Candidatus Omnitrophota bacterium]
MRYDELVCFWAEANRKKEWGVAVNIIRELNREGLFPEGILLSLLKNIALDKDGLVTSLAYFLTLKNQEGKRLQGLERKKGRIRERDKRDLYLYGRLIDALWQNFVRNYPKYLFLFEEGALSGRSFAEDAKNLLLEFGTKGQEPVFALRMEALAREYGYKESFSFLGGQLEFSIFAEAGLLAYIGGLRADAIEARRQEIKQELRERQLEGAEEIVFVHLKGNEGGDKDGYEKRIAAAEEAVLSIFREKIYGEGPEGKAMQAFKKKVSINGKSVEKQIFRARVKNGAIINEEEVVSLINRVLSEGVAYINGGHGQTYMYIDRNAGRTYVITTDAKYSIWHFNEINAGFTLGYVLAGKTGLNLKELLKIIEITRGKMQARPKAGSESYYYFYHHKEKIHKALWSGRKKDKNRLYLDENTNNFYILNSGHEDGLVIDRRGHFIYFGPPQKDISALWDITDYGLLKDIPFTPEYVSGVLARDGFSSSPATINLMLRPLNIALARYDIYSKFADNKLQEGGKKINEGKPKEALSFYTTALEHALFGYKAMLGKFPLRHKLYSKFEQQILALEVCCQEIVSSYGPELNRQSPAMSFTYQGRLKALHNELSRLLKRGGRDMELPLIVVDVGIGSYGAPTTFDLAESLSEAGFKNLSIYGIDNNIVFLRKAEDKLACNKLASRLNLKIKFQFAQDFEFTGLEELYDKETNAGKADMVIAANVLMYYDSYSRKVAIARMLRVLNAKGILSVSTGPSVVYHDYTDFSVYDKDGRYINNYEHRRLFESYERKRFFADDKSSSPLEKILKDVPSNFADGLLIGAMRNSKGTFVVREKAYDQEDVLHLILKVDLHNFSERLIGWNNFSLKSSRLVVGSNRDKDEIEVKELRYGGLGSFLIYCMLRRAMENSVQEYFIFSPRTPLFSRFGINQEKVGEKTGYYLYTDSLKREQVEQALITTGRGERKSNFEFIYKGITLPGNLREVYPNKLNNLGIRREGLEGQTWLNLFISSYYRIHGKGLTVQDIEYIRGLLRQEEKNLQLPDAGELKKFLLETISTPYFSRQENFEKSKTRMKRCFITWFTGKLNDAEKEQVLVCLKDALEADLLYNREKVFSAVDILNQLGVEESYAWLQKLLERVKFPEDRGAVARAITKIDCRPIGSIFASSSPATALHQGKVVPLSKDTIQCITELLLEELRVVPLKAAEERQTYSYNGYFFKREAWGIVEGGKSKALFIRIGYLFFLDFTAYSRLSPALKEILGTNVILLRQLWLNEIAKFPFSWYNAPAIISIMGKGVVTGKVVLDGGAGYGIISLVALKLGASFAHLFDSYWPALVVANMQLELNGKVRGFDFRLCQGDITQKTFIKEQVDIIRDDIRGTPKEIIVISNIGVWPEVYTATNAHSIDLIRHLPEATHFIGAGYTHTPSLNFKQTEHDRAFIRRLGFKVETEPLRVGRTELIAAWSAKRASSPLDNGSIKSFLFPISLLMIGIDFFKKETRALGQCFIKKADDALYYAKGKILLGGKTVEEKGRDRVKTFEDLIQFRAASSSPAIGKKNRIYSLLSSFDRQHERLRREIRNLDKPINLKSAKAGYLGYFPYACQYFDILLNILCYVRYLKASQPREKIRILEIGSGPGWFLLFLKEIGTNNLKGDGQAKELKRILADVKFQGLEINEDFSRFAKGMGLAVQKADLLKPLSLGKYDITYTNNVLDALQKDSELKVLSNKKPDFELGKVVLTRMNRLTKMGGFGIHRAEFGFPFNPDILKKSGFEIIDGKVESNFIVLVKTAETNTASSSPVAVASWLDDILPKLTRVLPEYFPYVFDNSSLLENKRNFNQVTNKFLEELLLLINGRPLSNLGWDQEHPVRSIRWLELALKDKLNNAFDAAISLYEPDWVRLRNIRVPVDYRGRVNLGIFFEEGDLHIAVADNGPGYGEAADTSWKFNKDIYFGKKGSGIASIRDIVGGTIIPQAVVKKGAVFKLMKFNLSIVRELRWRLIQTLYIEENKKGSLEFNFQGARRISGVFGDSKKTSFIREELKSGVRLNGAHQVTITELIIPPGFLKSKGEITSAPADFGAVVGGYGAASPITNGELLLKDSPYVFSMSAINQDYRYTFDNSVYTIALSFKIPPSQILLALPFRMRMNWRKGKEQFMKIQRVLGQFNCLDLRELIERTSAIRIKAMKEGWVETQKSVMALFPFLPKEERESRLDFIPEFDCNELFISGGNTDPLSNPSRREENFQTTDPFSHTRDNFTYIVKVLQPERLLHNNNIEVNALIIFCGNYFKEVLHSLTQKNENKIEMLKYARARGLPIALIPAHPCDDSRLYGYTKQAEECIDGYSYLREGLLVPSSSPVRNYDKAWERPMVGRRGSSVGDAFILRASVQSCARKLLRILNDNNIPINGALAYAMPKVEEATKDKPAEWFKMAMQLGIELIRDERILPCPVLALGVPPAVHSANGSIHEYAKNLRRLKARVIEINKSTRENMLKEFALTWEDPSSRAVEQVLRKEVYRGVTKALSYSSSPIEAYLAKQLSSYGYNEDMRRKGYVGLNKQRGRVNFYGGDYSREAETYFYRSARIIVIDNYYFPLFDLTRFAGQGLAAIGVDMLSMLQEGYAYDCRSFQQWTVGCLLAMQELKIKDKIVIDAGSGDGVITFAALTLGAKKIYALDMHKESREIILKSLGINGLPQEKINFKYFGCLFSELKRRRDFNGSVDILVANLTHFGIPGLAGEYDNCLKNDDLADLTRFFKPKTVIISGNNNIGYLKQYLASKKFSYRIERELYFEDEFIGGVLRAVSSSPVGAYVAGRITSSPVHKMWGLYPKFSISPKPQVGYCEFLLKSANNGNASTFGLNDCSAVAFTGRREYDGPVMGLAHLGPDYFYEQADFMINIISWEKVIIDQCLFVFTRNKERHQDYNFGRRKILYELIEKRRRLGISSFVQARYIEKWENYAVAALFMDNQGFELVDSCGISSIPWNAFVDKLSSSPLSNSLPEIFLGELGKISLSYTELNSVVIRLLKKFSGQYSYTRVHSERVAQYSLLLAKGLVQKKNGSLDWAGFLLNAYLAGLLHDIGKTNIPKKIVNGKTGLNEKELIKIKTHVSGSVRILKKYPIFSREVIDGVRFHHQGWNGQGYPYQLTGENIPLIASIVSVADVFDATTNRRPYHKKVLDPQTARKKIILGRGEQFNPKVVDIFEELYFENKIEPIMEDEVSDYVKTIMSGIIEQKKMETASSPVEVRSLKVDTASHSFIINICFDKPVEDMVRLELFNMQKQAIGYFDIFLSCRILNYLYINPEFRSRGFSEFMLAIGFGLIEDGLFKEGLGLKGISTYVRNPLLARSLLKFGFEPSPLYGIQDLGVELIIGAKLPGAGNRKEVYIADLEKREAFNQVITDDSRDYGIFYMVDRPIHGSPVRIYENYYLTDEDKYRQYLEYFNIKYISEIVEEKSASSALDVLSGAQAVNILKERTGAILKLEEYMPKDSRWENIAEVIAALDKNYNRWFVAMEEGQFRGYALYNRKIGDLFRLIVIPQKKGYGSKLLDNLLESLSESGIKNFWIIPINKKSRRFYEKYFKKNFHWKMQEQSGGRPALEVSWIYRENGQPTIGSAVSPGRSSSPAAQNFALMPMKSFFVNAGVWCNLPDYFSERVTKSISWEEGNIYPSGIRGGRTAVFPLRYPVECSNGKIIRALEIKGILFREGNSVRPPLQETYRVFNIPELNAQGEIILRDSTALKGGLPYKSAENEYRILKELSKSNSGYGYPVGYGRYRDYRYEDKDFGFLIRGVSQYPEKRIWGLLREEHRDNLYNNISLWKKYSHLFEKYGLAMRNFHDAGFFHNYPHLGNISWDSQKQRIIFHDFETCLSIKSQPPKRKVAYRLMDLFSAYSHFLNFVFGKHQKFYDLYFLENELNVYGNPFVPFFRGYFSGAETDLNSLSLQVIDGFFSGMIEPVVEIDSEIIQMLFDIEASNQEADSGLSFKASSPVNDLLQKTISLMCRNPRVRAEFFYIMEEMRREAFILLFAGSAIEEDHALIDYTCRKHDDYDSLYSKIKQFTRMISVTPLYGNILCFLACTIENLNQHVRGGLALTVVYLTKDMWIISVNDNGDGFRDRKGQLVKTEEVIKWRKILGKNGRKGKGLTIAAGREADLTVISHPQESSIIVPLPSKLHPKCSAIFTTVSDRTRGTSVTGYFYRGLLTPDKDEWREKTISRLKENLEEGIYSPIISSSPVDLGRLGWKSIAIPNVKVPGDSIALRRIAAKWIKDRPIKTQYLFYNIGFQQRGIKDNYIELLLDYQKKNIRVEFIETRWGRHFVEPSGARSRRWSRFTQPYPGVGSTIIDFLRQEALRLDWKVSFTSLKDLKGDWLRKLIKRNFKDIRVADSFQLSDGYNNNFSLWDGKELGNTVVGRPRSNQELNGQVSTSSPVAKNLAEQIENAPIPEELKKSLLEVSTFTSRDFCFERLWFKAQQLLAYEGKNKLIVQAAIYNGIIKMAQAVSRGDCGRGQVLGLSGEISGLYEAICQRGTVLENISLGTVQSINAIVYDKCGESKEFDAVSENSVFEFKFHLTLRKLYQQVIGISRVYKPHLKVLTEPRFSHIRNIVYFGETDDGRVVKAITAFAQSRAKDKRSIPEIIVVKNKGISAKFTLSQMKDFLLCATTIKFAQEEEKMHGARFLPKNYRYMNKIINRKLGNLRGAKFDVIVGVSTANINTLIASSPVYSAVIFSPEVKKYVLSFSLSVLCIGVFQGTGIYAFENGTRVESALEVTKSIEEEKSRIREDTLKIVRGDKDNFDLTGQNRADCIRLLFAGRQRAIFGGYLRQVTSGFSRQELTEVKNWRLAQELNYARYTKRFASEEFKERIKENTWMFRKNTRASYQEESFIANSNHEAYDIFAQEGAEILSFHSGLVVVAAGNWLFQEKGWLRGTGLSLKGGNVVIIYNPELKSYAYYSHLKDILVKPGDIVIAGENIATIGKTGLNAMRKPAHLHFEYKTSDSSNNLKAARILRTLKHSEKSSSSPVDSYKEALFQNVNLAMKGKDYPGALACLKKILFHYPHDADAIASYMRIIQETGCPQEEILRNINEVIQVKQLSSAAYYIRSLLYYERKDFANCLADLYRAIESADGASNYALHLLNKIIRLDMILEKQHKPYVAGISLAQEIEDTVHKFLTHKMSLKDWDVCIWEGVSYTILANALFSSGRYEEASEKLNVALSAENISGIEASGLKLDRYLSRAFSLRACLALSLAEESLTKVELNWVNGCLVSKEDESRIEKILKQAEEDMIRAEEASDRAYLDGAKHLWIDNLRDKLQLIIENDYARVLLTFPAQEGLRVLHQTIAVALRKNGGRRFNLNEVEAIGTGVNIEDVESLKSLGVIHTLQDCPRTYYYSGMRLFIILPLG